MILRFLGTNNNYAFSNNNILFDTILDDDRPMLYDLSVFVDGLKPAYAPLTEVQEVNGYRGSFRRDYQTFESTTRWFINNNKADVELYHKFYNLFKCEYIYVTLWQKDVTPVIRDTYDILYDEHIYTCVHRSPLGKYGIMQVPPVYEDTAIIPCWMRISLLEWAETDHTFSQNPHRVISLKYRRYEPNA